MARVVNGCLCSGLGFFKMSQVFQCACSTSKMVGKINTKILVLTDKTCFSRDGTHEKTGKQLLRHRVPGKLISLYSSRLWLHSTAIACPLAGPPRPLLPARPITSSRSRPGTAWTRCCNALFVRDRCSARMRQPRWDCRIEHRQWRFELHPFLWTDDHAACCDR